MAQWLRRLSYWYEKCAVHYLEVMGWTPVGSNLGCVVKYYPYVCTWNNDNIVCWPQRDVDPHKKVSSSLLVNSILEHPALKVNDILTLWSGPHTSLLWCTQQMQISIIVPGSTWIPLIIKGFFVVRPMNGTGEWNRSPSFMHKVV